MFNATRIRIYPTVQQAEALSVQFGCARWVWNDALAASQAHYRATGTTMKYREMSLRLPKLKREFEWLKDAHAQVLQQSVQNLSRAFENFFAKRGGYPRFKAKNDAQSIQYPQNVRLRGSRILLPKIGWVRCVVHRELIGSMKTVTVSRNRSGQFYAAILTEDDAAMPPASTDGKAIGIDLGLKHLAVTSDGAKFDNPRHLHSAEKNLKRKQRKYSRKKKGSNGKEKARKLVARAHERIACARKDYLHKLSHRIVSENQVIAVETLNVKGILQNRSLAKATCDAGWWMFTTFLEYKAARAGKAFVKCDRWYPSSKTCSECGSVCDRLPLNVRSWTCAKCGAHHDRDVNAAKNIRDEGLRILAGGMPATASGGLVSRDGQRKLARAA